MGLSICTGLDGGVGRCAILVVQAQGLAALTPQSSPEAAQRPSISGSAISTGQIALILLLATTLGANHIAARVAFDHGTSVLFAVSMRSAGTAVVLGCWLLLIRQRILIPDELRLKALAVGLLVSAQSFFLYSAVQRMPVALALLVFNLFPMMLGFLSWGLGGDRPSRRAWIGMPIALGGLGFALAAGLSMALIMALTQRWLTPIEGKVRALCTLSIVGVASLSAGLAVGGLTMPADRTGWLAVGILTLLYGSAFSTLLIAVPKIGPVKAAPFFNFEPVAAMAMGWLILDQSVKAIQITGAAVVIAALVFISWPKRH
jgi:drug/metabolite transporter (DMT)-like permease